MTAFEEFARSCRAQRKPFDKARERMRTASGVAVAEGTSITPSTFHPSPLAANRTETDAQHLEFPAYTLCIDPGETTGVALYNAAESILETQVSANALMERLDFLSTLHPLTHVVAEDYLIYQSHLKEHTWSRVPTLRLLGKIEYWCELRHLNLTLQTAAQVKPFATDALLKRFGLYHPGKPHARDAVRHGAYFLCFGDW